ncbi:formimidoylglutamase [Vibrio sp. E150_011]
MSVDPRNDTKAATAINEQTKHTFVWQGRDDQEDGERRYRLHHVMTPITTLAEITNGHRSKASSPLALLGFGTDEGVKRNKGRIGAHQGPDLIRQTLCNLAWHGQDGVYDLGNVDTTQGTLEYNQALTANLITRELPHAPIVVLGGGHEIAWASFLGLAQHLKQHETAPRIGIINFDAHFDLRSYQSDESGCHGHPLQPSSGTPFSQIADYCQSEGLAFQYMCIGVSKASNTQALFDRAEQLSVTTLLDDDLLIGAKEAHLDTLECFMDSVDHLYLTIDLDVFNAAHAPGVSAPAALGISLDTFYPYFNAILQQGDKIRVADIAEYNPEFDIDGQTARLAARLIWQVMSRLTQAKKANPITQ